MKSGEVWCTSFVSCLRAAAGTFVLLNNVNSVDQLYFYVLVAWRLAAGAFCSTANCVKSLQIVDFIVLWFCGLGFGCRRLFPIECFVTISKHDGTHKKFFKDFKFVKIV